MTHPKLPLDRRALMAGLGAAALGPIWPAAALAQAPAALALPARPEDLVLRPGGSATAIWSLGSPGIAATRGDTLDVGFSNDLPVPAALIWRGLEGLANAEPLLARAPLAAGAKERLQLPLHHAGTFLCDASLLGDGQARPWRARALVVRESEPVAVDREQVMLIEEWRLRSDGTAVAPGIALNDAIAAFTANGRLSFDIAARSNERIRIRFISGCQRSVIAVKIENLGVRVMALDGQPSEPFDARNGALVLAPGGRADVFIDVTAPAGTSSAILIHDGQQTRPIGKLVVSGEAQIRPAPLPTAPPLASNGLPAQLDLRSAQRVDLPIGGPNEWTRPVDFKPASPPAFRAKAGRVVVLTLTNRAPIANVFHLHGHHFRLLDRLDDGWKPFWLDTLAIEPGQTQRIAFAAEYPGRYLMESTATDWAAPRLVRWYSVE